MYVACEIIVAANAEKGALVLKWIFVVSSVWLQVENPASKMGKYLPFRFSLKAPSYCPREDVAAMITPTRSPETENPANRGAFFAAGASCRPLRQTGCLLSAPVV